MTIGIKMTASQFLMLGQDPPGVRLELVHGDVVVSPSPAYDHSYADRELSRILGNHIVENDLGELVGDVDTLFGEYDVRRPDIIFIAKQKLHLLNPKKHGIHFSPTLCVEILSPASTDYDQNDKFDLYLEYGVPFYWLVDPSARTFTAYKLSRKRYTKIAAGSAGDIVAAEPFPDLQIPLARLWAPSRRR